MSFLQKRVPVNLTIFCLKRIFTENARATATVLRLLNYFLEQLRLYFCAFFQLHEYIADGKVEYDLLWLVLHLYHYLNKLLLINIFTLFTFNITSTYSNETLAQDLNFMDVRSVHKITSQMLKKCSLGELQETLLQWANSHFRRFWLSCLIRFCIIWNGRSDNILSSLV